MATLTSFGLHLSRLETLVKHTNTQPDIDTHLLFIDLACKTILDEDVGGVRTEFVASIGDLGDDLGVPLALGLTSSYETAHHHIVDLAPVGACAGSDVRDDVGVFALVQAWLVADGALADLNDVLVIRIVLVGPIALITCGSGLRGVECRSFRVLRVQNNLRRGSS